MLLCRAAVLVFDDAGNLLRAWGGTGAGYEWPETEHGIFIDDNDFVWTAGSGNKDSQILKFTLDGKFVLQIGKSGQSKGSNDTANLGSPADLNVDTAAKEVYVADGYRNRRIIVFDSETGAYKRHWGAYGKPPSDDKTPAYDPAQPPAQQFGRPVHCVRFSKDGLVYVCDRINDRVQMFKKDGTFVAEAFFEKNTGSTAPYPSSCFQPTATRSSFTWPTASTTSCALSTARLTKHSRASAGRALRRPVPRRAQHRSGPAGQRLHD